MSLDDLGIKHGTDKCSKCNGYLGLYEQYVAKYRQQHITLLEIGVYDGSSLAMWEEYFTYNKARFYGMDVDARCKDVPHSKRSKIVIGSQSDLGCLKTLAKRVPTFDIIIDDGGHTMKQQQRSLGYLFRYLKSGGLYVIEDLITSHPDYEQRNYNPTKTKWTTLEMLKEYGRSGCLNSEFISNVERKYIQDRIDRCSIERGKFSEIAFLTKR